jgi:hypothetical protein
MSDWDINKAGEGLSKLIPQRNYQGLNAQTEQLRVWLPSPAKVALEEIAQQAESSMTVYLIEYFVSYLYGQHELLRMRETRTGIYEPQNHKACAMAPTPRLLPNLGKNIYALKMFVPLKLKLDLQALADKTAVTLGEYTRSLICAHLFGQEYGLRNFFEISVTEAETANEWNSLQNEETEDDAW